MKEKYRLTRTKFTDRPLDPQHLWALAELWRGGISRSGFRKSAACQLRAEIWGFARRDAALLRRQLASTAPGLAIDNHNPDRLIVRGVWTDLSQSPNLAPWLAPLLCRDCSGLFVVLRISVCDAAPPPGQSPATNQSLALGGLPEGGKFLLKAAWHAGNLAIAEHIGRGAAWEHEAALLRAMDTFLHTFSRHPSSTPGSPQFAAALADAQQAAWHVASAIGGEFLSRPKERLGDLIARYIAEFPDDHSPSAFFRRCIIPLILLFTGLCLALRAPPRAAARPFLIGLAILGIGLLARIFFLKATRVIGYYLAMNRGLRALYAQDITIEKMPLEPAFESNPTCRKYSTELQAIGATHCYDFRIVAKTQHLSAQRLYCIPAQHTLLTLGIMTRTGSYDQFPGLLIWHLSTRFKDGTRVATINTAKFKKVRMPGMLGSAHAGIDDPAELLALHAGHVRHLIAKGHVPEDCDPDNYPARSIAEHEETRAFYAHRTIYTWSDALHQAFDIVRKNQP